MHTWLLVAWGLVGLAVRGGDRGDGVRYRVDYLRGWHLAFFREDSVLDGFWLPVSRIQERSYVVQELELYTAPHLWGRPIGGQWMGSVYRGRWGVRMFFTKRNWRYWREPTMQKWLVDMFEGKHRELHVGLVYGVLDGRRFKAVMGGGWGWRRGHARRIRLNFREETRRRVEYLNIGGSGVWWGVECRWYPVWFFFVYGSVEGRYLLRHSGRRYHPLEWYGGGGLGVSWRWVRGNSSKRV